MPISTSYPWNFIHFDKIQLENPYSIRVLLLCLIQMGDAKHKCGLPISFSRINIFMNE